MIRQTDDDEEEETSMVMQMVWLSQTKASVHGN